MGNKHDYDLRAYTKGQVWYMENNILLNEEVAKSTNMTIGVRPVLIYSAINCAAHYVTAIPITTKLDYKNGVKVNLGRESTVLVHEIQPVALKQLTKFLGNIEPRKMEEIDIAVRVYFGLIDDDELRDKYFYQTNNIRTDDMIHSTIYPAPSIKQVHNFVQIPLDDTEEKQEGSETQEKRTYKKLDVRTLTEDEKNFILTAKTSEIADRYGISKATVYNYRTTLKHMKNMEAIKK